MVCTPARPLLCHWRSSRPTWVPLGGEGLTDALAGLLGIFQVEGGLTCTLPCLPRFSGWGRVTDTSVGQWRFSRCVKGSPDSHQLVSSFRWGRDCGGSPRPTKVWWVGIGAADAPACCWVPWVGGRVADASLYFKFNSYLFSVLLFPSFCPDQM